jgi:DnaD/phage-associated family protein
MGDTGSLTLGGIVAVSCIIIRKELLIPILCGIYLAQSVSVIMQVSYFKYTKKRYGEGRRPTLRQIEKEGYYWGKLGLFDQESAAAYLRDYAAKQEKMGAYLRALQISGRKSVESEEKYITRWIEQGISPELVALAYDQTILYKKELNWRYLNAILRRWQEQGWRTAEDVENGSRKPRHGQNSRNEREDKNDWMLRYIKK